MKTQSYYSDLAIDLLSGLVKYSEAQPLAPNYDEISARCDRIEHSLTSSLGETNAIGWRQSQTTFLRAPEGSRNTERIPKQNARKKTCTYLASEHHFTCFPKDVFRRPPPPIFKGFQTGSLTSPRQESGAINGNSVHHRFSKLPCRQDSPLICSTRALGRLASRGFWFFIRLMQLMFSATFTAFDNSVQG